MLPWVIGYAGDPGFELIVTLQILMVPILLAAFVSAFRDNPEVVPVLAVAPALISWLLIVSIAAWARSLEFVPTVLAVGIVTLAFSGSWAVLGYATGTAARWSRRETVGKHTLVRACLGVGLGSAIVYAAYLVALAALLIGGIGI